MGTRRGAQRIQGRHRVCPGGHSSGQSGAEETGFEPGRQRARLIMRVWWRFLITCIGVGFSILKGVIDGNGGVVGIIGFFLFWICVGFGAISAVMLYRVTKNCLTIPKRTLDATDD